jgi:hypothetical protein
MARNFGVEAGDAGSAVAASTDAPHYDWEFEPGWNSSGHIDGLTGKSTVSAVSLCWMSDWVTLLRRITAMVRELSLLQASSRLELFFLWIWTHGWIGTRSNISLLAFSK